MQHHTLPLFLTVHEAAALIAMPTSWVYAECRRYHNTRGREGLPCKRFGRAVRVHRDKFMEYIER